MRQFAFFTSSTLAVAGSTIAVLGVTGESLKFVAIGIILILTAGVFATLTLATRAKDLKT